MPFSAGTRLGRYEIIGSLGAGGMGEVYRARDPRLDRDVAIKVLPPQLTTDPQALARFEREAKAVAALSHPNILVIYDVGRQRGIAYAVTELLKGETLRSRLEHGALGWREAVEVAVEVADALTAAHSRHIIHRDLKPENIFLIANGQVKVLDFGLARRNPPKSTQDTTAAPTETQPGLVMGTVGYMSPEQVRGLVAEAPSDIFSLGCVLYEMIAGRRPFARETPVQTMTAILEQHPPRLAPSGEPIPQELDDIVVQSLAKRPEDRIQSARDLGIALRKILSSPGGYATHVARPRVRLGPAGWWAAALAVVLLATGIFWFSRPGTATDSIAILPFVNAGGNAEMDYLSEGITESLINSLSETPNLRVMSRNSVFRYKGRETDAQRAGHALKVKAVLTGRIVQRGDLLSVSAELTDVDSNRQLWGEQYNRKLVDILAVQEEISTQISRKLQLRLTGRENQRLPKRYTKSNEAYQLYLQGRYYWNKKTAPGFNKGIEYFEKAILADPNYAPAYAGLATLYFNLSNYNFALLPPREAWPKAKAAAEKALQLDDTLASAHAALALVAYQWDWDWDRAETEFKRALELDPGSSSTYEPTPSSTNHWYSHFLMSVGRSAESLAAGRRALELEPLDLGINSHQGWHYLFTREYDRAIEPLQKTIAMDSNFSIARLYLGFIREQTRALPDAIVQFENCVRITGARPSMLATLAHAYAISNQRSQAERILQQLSALSKQQYVASYPVAAINLALGKKEEALAQLEKAYEERDAWMDYLGVDPRLDDLRSDARFVNLLRGMNLQSFLRK